MIQLHVLALLAQDITSLKSIPPGIRAGTVAMYSTIRTNWAGGFPARRSLLPSLSHFVRFASFRPLLSLPTRI